MMRSKKVLGKSVGPTFRAEAISKKEYYRKTSTSCNSNGVVF